MQTTALTQHLSDLSAIDINIRSKATKLLNKICDNILSNPSESKYHDLNFQKMRKKLDKCPPAIALLYDIGFKLSNDGLRFKWVQNTTNSDLLQQLSQHLKDEHSSSVSANSRNSGTIATKMCRQMAIIFNRIKTPNDLPSQIETNTKLISQLQAQNAPHFAIQHLSDHTEALVFVHELETTAQTDPESMESMKEFKQLLALWSDANIMDNFDSSTGSASAELEAQIFVAKHYIESTLRMKKSMDKENQILSKLRMDLGKHRKELQDAFGELSNAMQQASRTNNASAIDTDNKEDLCDDGKDVKLKQVQSNLSTLQMAVNEVQEEKVNNEEYDPYDINEHEFGAFIIGKINEKTAQRMLQLLKTGKRQTSDDEIIRPEQVIHAMLIASVLYLKFMEKTKKIPEIQVDKKKLKRSLMPAFDWMLKNKFDTEEYNVSKGIKKTDLYKLLGKWLQEYYQTKETQ